MIPEKPPHPLDPQDPFSSHFVLAAFCAAVFHVLGTWPALVVLALAIIALVTKKS